MAEETIILDFFGPFSWRGSAEAPSIFGATVARQSGIYMWTISVEGSELVYYVGETGRDFETRMLEHFREHCSGGYHIYSPSEFRHGMKIPLWPGRYDPAERTTVADFVVKAPELWPAILDLINIYRFFLAPLQYDRRLRERIEGAIAAHLYGQKGPVGDFQDRGIRYRPRMSKEAPIAVAIGSWEMFRGLPPALEV
ncbi:MAG: hypothetical protein WCC06_03525 [Candidatus Aminicenantales bacterium]